MEIWRSAPARGASELDWTLARAATIVVALLVAHSFVDYPLRTGAMMAVMAFACALLIEPPLGAETQRSTDVSVGGKDKAASSDAEACSCCHPRGAKVSRRWCQSRQGFLKMPRLAPMPVSKPTPQRCQSLTYAVVKADT